MRDKSPEGQAVGSPSVFEVASPQSNLHIIDQLIVERCPSFAEHWSWPVVRPILFGLLGYRKAVRWADHMQGLPGAEAFNYLTGQLDMKINVENMARIPATGRAVVIANHPTGLADGAAVWDALMGVRKDVMFLANADAVRVVPGFVDTIIPVEWVTDKRSPAKTRETLKLAGEAFAQEKCIVIFPSGKLAKMIDGTLTEQDWFSTAVALARKKKAPIIPLNVSAQNSLLYYMLSRLNGELRDITLFKELVNKRHARFDMTVGLPIMPETLIGDAGEITEQLRDYVSYALPKAPDAAFVPADLSSNNSD